MKRCFHCMGEYEEELQCCPVCEFTGEQEKGTWLEPGNILQGRYIVGTCRYQKEFDILYIGWDALFSRRILIQEFVPRSWGVRKEEGNLSIPDSKMELFEEAKNVFMSTGLKLISLDDAPGLLNVFSVFEDNNTAYITMEYPGEKTLLTILNTCGCFQENDMLYLVKELAIPLKRAHKNQVFHGQLCLDSCFLDDNGEYKLGCFLEIRYVCEDFKPPNASVDVWCFANLAGMILLGEKEWESSTKEEQYELLEKSCSAVVAETLIRSLSGDEKQRPQTIELFCSELLEEGKTLDTTHKIKQSRKKNHGWLF